MEAAAAIDHAPLRPKGHFLALQAAQLGEQALVAGNGERLRVQPTGERTPELHVGGQRGDEAIDQQTEAGIGAGRWQHGSRFGPFIDANRFEVGEALRERTHIGAHLVEGRFATGRGPRIPHPYGCDDQMVERFGPARVVAHHNHARRQILPT